MELETGKLIDLDALGEELALWFTERDWEIKQDKGPSTYVIQAKKAGTLRYIFGACRALVVICRHDGDKTKVLVRQGSWTENIMSNLVMFLETGGTNLLFTLWSFEVQREFEEYVKGVLAKLPRIKKRKPSHHHATAVA